MGSILPKVIREVFQKTRTMMISRGKTFHVVGKASAKTMSLGFAWCVHTKEIKHCSQSGTKKKEGRDETGKIMEHYEGCAGGNKIGEFEQ